MGGLGQLLDKTDDAAVSVHRHHAEAAGLLAGHFQAGDRDIGALVAMLAQHQLIIHFVDMVARQDDHIFRSMAFDDVDILEHRIGGAFIPLGLGDALRSRQHVEAFVALGPQEVPALLQMADQGMGFVLGGDADAANTGVDRIGQCEVDDARLAAEIDRRFGAAFGQFGQTAAAAARQHIRHRIACQRLSAPIGHVPLLAVSKSLFSLYAPA